MTSVRLTCPAESHDFEVRPSALKVYLQAKNGEGNYTFNCEQHGRQIKRAERHVLDLLIKAGVVCELLDESSDADAPTTPISESEISLVEGANGDMFDAQLAHFLDNNQAE